MSPSGLYVATFGTDGNLTVTTTSGYLVWSAGVAGKGGTKLTFTASGDLSIEDGAGTTVWSTGTGGRGATDLSLGDDGILLLGDRMVPIWSSLAGSVGAQPPDVLLYGEQLLPGQSLRSTSGGYELTMRTDGNLAITNALGTVTWSTQTQGHPGSKLIYQRNGNLAVLMPDGWSTWQSGPFTSLDNMVVLGQDGVLRDEGPDDVLWTSASGVVSSAMQSPLAVVFGDSLTVQASSYFEADLSAQQSPPVNWYMQNFPGTAICDFLPEMRTMDGAHPSIALIQFSGNTATNCISPVAKTYGLAGANARYEQDLLKAIDTFLTYPNARVVVMGSPAVNPRLSVAPWNHLIRQSQIDVVSDLDNPRVTYVDGGAWVDNPGTGAFEVDRPCAAAELFFHTCTGPIIAGVRNNVVRASDGVHFCNVDDPACEPYSAGAWRFGAVEALPVELSYGLNIFPGPPTP
jgi:hypothetical protein